MFCTLLKSLERYPERFRRISYRDRETGKALVFLTNNFDLPAVTIAQLYKSRWRVELFFKWIKQNLRIKHFFGTSDNAVKTQVWIAICVYVLVFGCIITPLFVHELVVMNRDDQRVLGAEQAVDPVQQGIGRVKFDFRWGIDSVCGRKSSTDIIPTGCDFQQGQIGCGLHYLRENRL